MISIEQVIQKAVAYDKDDARRIHHFLKVYAYADTIGRLEGLSEDEQSILQTAAVLHDIGIHKAEEKYGSSSGHFQELEGPAPARAILEELGARHISSTGSPSSSPITIPTAVSTGLITKSSWKPISWSMLMKIT